ncbi:MAG TPA: diacylglycerol kinase family protein [Actinomycetota bacterium]
MSDVESRAGSARRVGARRRLAAIGAIVLALVVVVLTILFVSGAPAWFALQLVLIAVAALSAWYAVTRVGGRRAIGFLIAALALVGFVLAGLVNEGGGLASVVIRVVALTISLGLARYALALDLRSLKSGDTPGVSVPPAGRGVLIMNLKSGGGKAEKHGLVEECRARNIEPIVLQPGDDLLEIAREAADRGADVIGMAGGDGSQALVATVAAERGLPMVVVPAGTRNHLALDLGLDRKDVVGALDAFGEARERPMDLAEVNGRVFVNNVSLGLYAVVVRSPEYRANKVDTTLATLPTVLAPGTGSFDLRFRSPDGHERSGAHVIQISNNPYGRTMGGLGSRPRLDTGLLGVITLEINGDREAAQFLSALAGGHPERFAGFEAWSTPEFEVGSGGPIDIGLDGETFEMDPPLRFTIRPGAIRVRLPRHAIGFSPGALALDLRTAARSLWRTALGKQAAVLPEP